MTVTRDLPRAPGSGPAPLPPPPVLRAVHRRDIEGLRAVAVLLVVLYHCGFSLLGGGYVGVDVFFVISGFLITSLLLREVGATGTISITGFYARRFLRLLPAAVLVTVVTVVAAIKWLPPLRGPSIALDGLFASVYSLNYRLAAVGTEYLNADAAPSPLQHFWSLAVEEQFYLLWPLLLLGAYTLRKRRGVTIALVSVVVLSFVISVWQTQASAQWAYFGLPARAWELGVGALVAVVALRPTRRTGTVLVAGGLAAIVIAAVVFTKDTAFPGYAAALPVLGTAAVLMGGTTAPSGLLSEPSLQTIGRLSYSWYLWHWPFLMIGPYALDVQPGLGVNLALAAGALIAAALTYALVENPTRHLRKLRARPRHTVAGGLVLTVVAAGGFLVLSHTSAQGGTRTDYVAAAPPAEVTQAMLAEGVLTPKVPDNLTPALAEATDDRPRTYDDDCHPGFEEAQVKLPCAYGDLTSDRTVVLFGDSHAAQWFPAMEAVAVRMRWRLVLVTKSSCSVAATRIWLDAMNRPYDECVAWRRQAWVHIAQLRPQLVVMASAGAAGELVDATGAKVTDQSYADRVWIDGWVESARVIRQTGARTVLLEDTPYQGSDPPECLSTHADDPAACVVGTPSAFAEAPRRRAIAAALGRDGVTVVDPTPWFCTPQKCPVIVGNVLVYRDPGHITATYIKMLAPQLEAALK